MLGYQLYYLMMILLEPIAFCWAIVPAWKESLNRWMAKTLHTLYMKIGWGM
ncbi:hypothetical protein SAMN05444392_12511 [Seinonella peptonophila]|uniref:Uncharacterized protein n=1 Tax=Seinonella peptonophila TaxID=112248 RepID=A0A1M5BL37_9BACL|nr:hypothetical protein [Seinonella peptonophila]SHF42922.1 hypothetical protein SAMN05444392_12511 [Seinonella peptonophila]